MGWRARNGGGTYGVGYHHREDRALVEVAIVAGNDVGDGSHLGEEDEEVEERLLCGLLARELEAAIRSYRGRTKSE